MDDDDLPPPGLDLEGYFRVLAARLGRVPTLGEVAVFRHDVCAERLRRMRRRKAARKAAKGGAPAPMGNRSGEKADAVAEFFTSFEWSCAVSIMLSMVVCITELAAFRLQGRRITIPKAHMVAAAAAVPVAPVERPPARLSLLPRPLGSFTPDAEMIRFAGVEARRREAAGELYGSHLYPRALAMLLRSSGDPVGKVEGRDAWAIVEEGNPAAAAYLRTLGSDPAEWSSLRLQTKKKQRHAAKLARMGAHPPAEPENSAWRGPAFIDRMMQASSPSMAAAHCARSDWRKRGVKLAAAASVADIDLSQLEAELNAELEEANPEGGYGHG